MRTYLHEVTGEFEQVLRALKAGKQVLFTEEGVPIAMVEPLRAASKQEERAMLEMIESGDLQPSRRSGALREWK